MAVQYWTEQMAADADTEIRTRKEELLDNELEKFMAHMNVASVDRQQDGWISF